MCRIRSSWGLQNHDTFKSICENFHYSGPRLVVKLYINLKWTNQENVEISWGV